MGNYKLVGRARRESSMLDPEDDSQNVAELIYQEGCLLSHNQEGGTREAAPGAVDLENTIAAI